MVYNLKQYLSYIPFLLVGLVLCDGIGIIVRLHAQGPVLDITAGYGYGPFRWLLL